MIDFLEVTQRIKLILQNKQGAKKVYDRDVAEALSLDAQYFAVIKKRKKIPYEAIAHFCHQHKISMNWILFEQDGSLPKEITLSPKRS